MKRMLIIIIITILHTNLYAQQKIYTRYGPIYESVSDTILPKIPDSLKEHKVYVGLGFGYPWAFTADLTYLSKLNLGMSFNFSTNSLRSEKLPSDYTSDLWGLAGKPHDHYNAFALLFVIAFYTPKAKVRPGLEGGVSYAFYEEAQYTRVDPGLGALFGASENYDVNYTKMDFLGFQGCFKVEILPTSTIGIELALVAHINDRRGFISFQAIFLLGRTREAWLPD